MKSLFEYIKIYIKSSGVRRNVSLLYSLIMNGCYIVSNILSGIIYRNPWFLAVSVYYALLLFSRAMLLYKGEKAVKGVAISLLILVPLMCFMMVYTTVTGSFRLYSGLLLLFFAVFSVQSFLRAVYGTVKLGKSNEAYGTLSVRLASAGMSVFNLAAPMISAAGLDRRFHYIAIIGLGTLVALPVLISSVSMLLKSKE